MDDVSAKPGNSNLEETRKPREANRSPTAGGMEEEYEEDFFDETFEADEENDSQVQGGLRNSAAPAAARHFLYFWTCLQKGVLADLPSFAEDGGHDSRDRDRHDLGAGAQSPITNEVMQDGMDGWLVLAPHLAFKPACLCVLLSPTKPLIGRMCV